MGTFIHGLVGVRSAAAPDAVEVRQHVTASACVAEQGEGSTFGELVSCFDVGLDLSVPMPRAQLLAPDRLSERSFYRKPAQPWNNLCRDIIGQGVLDAQRSCVFELLLDRVERAPAIDDGSWPPADFE